MSRTEKKSFFDLYAEQKKKPTPAQNFIAEIAALTHRSENTVKMWLWKIQCKLPPKTKRFCPLVLK